MATTATRTATKTTTLHVHLAFLYISLPSLHDYDIELPNFTFYGGSELKTAIFFFIFVNLETVL